MFRQTLLKAAGLVKAGLAQRGEQGFAVGALVVPGERQLAHQVRARGLEAVVAGQRRSDAIDATLAADPADLNRLGLQHG